MKSHFIRQHRMTCDFQRLEEGMIFFTIKQRKIYNADNDCLWQGRITLSGLPDSQAASPINLIISPIDSIPYSMAYFYKDFCS